MSVKRLSVADDDISSVMDSRFVCRENAVVDFEGILGMFFKRKCYRKLYIC